MTNMSDKRLTFLLNARLDGVLGPEENTELNTILESSAEARALEAEYQELARLIESQPELNPPEGLSGRIMRQVVLPESKPFWQPDKLFASFQPATAGLAFAAGLLVTVAVYEFVPDQGAVTSTKNLVGTMIANQEETPFQTLKGLSIDEPGLSGTIAMLRADEIRRLDFEIETDQRIEIVLGFAAAGLDFSGMSRKDASGKVPDGVYSVANGTLRVENPGQQAFSIFLTEAIEAGDNGGEIKVGLYIRETLVFSGVFNK
jgi:hypothetical protein